MAKFPTEVTESVVVPTSRVGMITTGIMGVGFSLVFLRRRRVADAMVAHAVLDLIVVFSLSTQR